MAYLKANTPKELSQDELIWSCDITECNLKSSSEIEPTEGIIGQERALKALKLGVDLRSLGYNVFITGLSGTGKFTTIKQTLEKISPNDAKLLDYAYVNNFEDEDHPILLVLPSGEGSKFKKAMASAIKFLQENIPQALETKPFLEAKKQLFNEMEAIHRELMTTFEAKLKKDNFTLGQVKIGEMTRPEILAVIGDETYFLNQLDGLVAEKKITRQKASSLTKKYADHHDELQIVFKKTLRLSKEFTERIWMLEKEAIDDLLKVSIGELKQRFPFAKIVEYLGEVETSVVNNLDLFKGQQPASEQLASGVIVDYMQDYEVNLLLDNSKLKSRPVIIETSPTYNNIFGAIEKYFDGNNWYADFTRIKAGSLLRANGGYLVINAMDAFSEPGVWKALKRVLLYGKLEIQDLSNYYQHSTSLLKPEPIEMDVKIIMIGSNYIYSMLSAYEDDFNKLFKIKSEFDYEMKRTERGILEYAGVIKKIIASENLLEFDASAVAKIIEYGARYAGDKNKLTTRFAYIADLVREANFWAKDVGNKIVNRYHVKQAYDAARERHGLGETKLNEMIESGTILINTEGERIGQINGLAVIGGGAYSFGKPARITASVGLGNGNIINVEREAGLSGNSHNKGMLIIGGYFIETFGSDTPLSFTASVVFEQGYGPIDGDSASVTEICALLSCFSEVPIKQSIAITGSVNQKGDIQPIGGVNEKIEGFFEVCRKKGLSNENGVIIPISNVKDLMLKEEVVEAVKKGEFHIYPVTKVEEAIEILTGVKAVERTKTGRHKVNTIYGMVDRKLCEMRWKIKHPKEQKNPKNNAPKKKKETENK